MAITRTPMVDDDGSGTTGTILNNAWKQELYGQIDGLLLPLALGPRHDQAITAPAHDNLDPGAGASKTMWFLTAPATTYLTGIAAPYAPGTVHILQNVGTALIVLAHLYVSSAANQIIGAGYANTDLPPWRSVWIVYDVGYNKWIVMKPPSP